MDVTNPKHWLYGLMGTAINGVASGVVLMVTNPTTFNLQDSKKLVTTCLLFGVLGAANYLKQSPLPTDGAPSTGSGTRAAGWFLLFFLVGGLYGCASASARHTAVGIDTAVYTGLSAFQDGEMARFKAGTIDLATHQKLNQALVPALKSGQAFNRAIRDWQPGTPMPTNLSTHVKDLAVLADAVAGFVKDPETRSALQAWLLTAQNAALAVLTAMPLQKAGSNGRTDRDSLDSGRGGYCVSGCERPASGDHGGLELAA